MLTLHFHVLLGQLPSFLLFRRYSQNPQFLIFQIVSQIENITELILLSVNYDSNITCVTLVEHLSKSDECDEGGTIRRL